MSENLKKTHEFGTSLDGGRSRGNRVGEWLVNGYEADTWMLKGSVGRRTTVTVKFEVMMPDGRLLTEHRALYATIKEFSFWIRASGYARIRDENTHASYINAAIRICIALLNMGFTSFSQLCQADVNDICVAASQGAGNLMGVRDRLNSYLVKYNSWDDVPDAEKVARPPQGGDNKSDLTYRFNRKAVLEACNLPPMLARPTTKFELASAEGRLNRCVVGKMKSKRKYQRVTVQSLFYITGTFEALYRLRHHIEAQTLMFLPFAKGASAKAEELSSPSQVTPIVPPGLMKGLLSEAISFLTEKAEQIVATHRRAITNKQQKNCYDNKFAEKARIDAVMLITACFIIVAAFTARRSEEIHMMERNCLRLDDDGCWWAKVYIAKTTRDYSWIPVPNFVVQAVATLRKLSETGADNQDGFLFRYYDPVWGREVNTYSPRKINAFAELVGMITYENHEKRTEVWLWQPRQFRRFFAVLFFYRYRGKKESLAHHLRHFNMVTTSGYLRLDPVLDAIWLEEMQHFRREVVLDIVDGNREYTGPMAERVRNEAARLRGIFRQSIVIVPERLASMVLKRLDKDNILLTPKPWTTCCCPNTYEGADRAACQRASAKGSRGIGPSLQDAEPAICMSCPWSLRDQDNLKFLEDERAALRRSHDCLPPSVFAELQAARLVVLSSESSFGGP